MDEENVVAAMPDWGPVRRILFRCGFLYLFLYLLPTYLGLLAYIPFAGKPVGWYFQIWSWLVPWAGKHLFQVDALLHPHRQRRLDVQLDAGLLLPDRTLAGTFDGKPVRASLHRIEAPKSLLFTRGFHWVSGYPFNR